MSKDPKRWERTGGIGDREGGEWVVRGPPWEKPEIMKTGGLGAFLMGVSCPHSLLGLSKF